MTRLRSVSFSTMATKSYRSGVGCSPPRSPRVELKADVARRQYWSTRLDEDASATAGLDNL